MKNNVSRLLLPLFVAVAIVIGAISTLMGPAQAAPPAAPTPVAAPDSSVDGTYFRFQPATAVTADGNTNSVNVLGFKTVDIEYTIDHGTVNTTTLTVQYSIEGDNWQNGVVLVTDSAADGSNLFARVPVYGRYMRVNQNVTNSNPITITVSAVGR